MKNFLTGLGAFFSVLILAIVVIAIVTYPIMWLWNALIPELFHGPVLTFWQTFGLLILVRAFTHNSSTTKSSE